MRISSSDNYYLETKEENIKNIKRRDRKRAFV